CARRSSPYDGYYEFAYW
nr:immunoglobulin heavy chain junction region [Mus musculus]MBK4187141.1 immunoglobulin heavy chain junction region [Mus musculus]MBK4187142.1 immunoglobulin heavy chain junction region [Mus musculus]MBK4187143.1 immunoglobulin heavy chain junction region [Mus musculus]MBK4187144.1 immunoglobulin heavy chain junction region [Mus musculus]